VSSPEPSFARLWELPVSSTSLTYEPVARLDPGELLIRFEYEDAGRRQVLVLAFPGCRAIKQLAERFSVAASLEIAYDTLVEIRNSPWLAELEDEARRHRQHSPGLHHYLIYLDDFGTLDVVADRWEIRAGMPSDW
jgi:hypothetical protein